MAPASASFRILKFLRCLVRSYVTIATIMRPITEMAANIPSPIGSTESFFPGGTKGLSATSAAAAAAAGDTFNGFELFVLLGLVSLPVDDEDCVGLDDGDCVRLDEEWVAGGTSSFKTGLPDELGFRTDETLDTAEEERLGFTADEVRVITGEDPPLPPEVVVEGGAPELESNDIVQVRSSLTILSPWSPRMGVKTMLHVSMKFPASVGMCVTVVTI